MAPGVGEEDEGRHVVVVVETDVNLHPALGATVVGPWEQALAERDGGGVEQKQLF